MKKRIISLIASVSLTASSLFLSGCENKEDNHGLDAENPVTITIWHYYNGVQQTYFDEMVNEFNETVGAENGIIVEAYTKSGISELAESVLDSFNGKVGADEVPDIFASYSEIAYTIESMGKTADLNNYFTDEEKQEYVDGYISEGEFSESGKLTIFPIAKSTEIMMLNTTDWEEFASAENITYDDLATWESLAQTAEKYYNYTDSLTPDIENDGKSFFGRDSIANYMIVGAKQLGSELFSSQDGVAEVCTDKEILKKLWECYYVPYVKGYYCAKGRYRSDDIKVGNIICAVCSTTGASYFPTEVAVNDDYSYPIETAVLPVPQFEGCDDYMVQQGAGMVVAKSDEVHEYASVMFLKWFTESERNIEFSVGSGYLPVKKDANDMEKINSIVENLENKPSDLLMSSISTAINNSKNSVLYSMKPFENAEAARDFAGSFIQDTADEAYNEIMERIEKGENREDILSEYTDEKAFEEWYNEFISEFSEI
jgi:multiple sugar transport system substrate-binding protein